MTKVFDVRDMKVYFQSQLQSQYCEVIITMRAIVTWILLYRSSFEPINWRKLLSWRIRASVMKIKLIKCSEFLCLLSSCIVVLTQYEPNTLYETSRQDAWSLSKWIGLQPATSSNLSSRSFLKSIFRMKITGVFFKLKLTQHCQGLTIQTALQSQLQSPPHSSHCWHFEWKI